MQVNQVIWEFLYLFLLIKLLAKQKVFEPQCKNFSCSESHLTVLLFKSDTKTLQAPQCSLGSRCCYVVGQLGSLFMSSVMSRNDFG